MRSRRELGKIRIASTLAIGGRADTFVCVDEPRHRIFTKARLRRKLESFHQRLDRSVRIGQAVHTQPPQLKRGECRARVRWETLQDLGVRFRRFVDTPTSSCEARELEKLRSIRTRE